MESSLNHRCNCPRLYTHQVEWITTCSDIRLPALPQFWLIGYFLSQRHDLWEEGNTHFNLYPSWKLLISVQHDSILNNFNCCVSRFALSKVKI